MNRPRATLQDVAAKAGVSRTTASFVMNGRHEEMRISSEARDRVLRSARELDYRPNLMARSLKTDLTHTIGFLSDSVATDGYAGQLITGALSAALTADRLLYVGEFVGDEELEARVIDSFLDRRVDGFIIASSYPREITIPPQIGSVPVVLANCFTSDPGVTNVLPDDHQGGFDIGNHLLAGGHHDEIFIVGEVPDDLRPAVDRRRGIEEALEQAGVSLAGSIDCKWWPESARETVGGALVDGLRPRALICMNDRVALGSYEALGRAGLDIPGDVSVVSFDDSPLASWLDPALDSMGIPHHQIGVRAIESLLAAESQPGTQLVPMHLTVRSSVSAPP